MGSSINVVRRYVLRIKKEKEKKRVGMAASGQRQVYEEVDFVFVFLF